MTDIKNESIALFLTELAGKQATPGGGSAAALMGAQAAALVSMVCNLTIGKAKYALVETEMQDILNQALHLQNHLTVLIQQDIDVFNKLMACYALPKITDQEKSFRNQNLQNVLTEAVDVSLACAQGCAKIIALSQAAAEMGYSGVISDAGVAAIAAIGGLKSSALNVYINTSSLLDKEFVTLKMSEINILVEQSEKQAEQVFELVKGKLLAPKS